ncbi:hypothetical protein OPT61_g5095 [Boeremia exigua]|uniref:Uncharacterized protein n=1 Tax=Boeremia exigua TaxID=749465 RepID=A0ACC2IBH9_9PLEO|nr:hypothetical protein OPT61_g5095 [Boeremia exigua]
MPTLLPPTLPSGGKSALLCIMQGALFTTPLPLVLLPPSDRECSICLEPYIEPDSAQQSQGREWAVRVELVAEVSGLRRCCGHIIGRQCLEAHLRSSGPWKRHCPFCRDPWFREPNRPASQTQNTTETQDRPARQRFTHLRSTARSNTNRERSRSPRNEPSQGGMSRQAPLQEQASFTQRVREKLRVKDGSDEVGRSLYEVEQVLNDFYGR